MGDSVESLSESAQEKEPVLSTGASKSGMNKALLIEDYPNMSTALKNLVASLNNPNVEDIVVALLYILVVETGFIPYPSDPVAGDNTCQYNARRLINTIPLPKTWIDDEGFYQVHFVLAPFPQVTCKLICIPTGSYLLANMYSTCSDKSFAIVINPAEFVTVYPDEVIFKRLKNLSLNFKSQVVVPVRTVMLNELHQTNCGLFALPVEVLMKITSFLRVKDFLMWTSTCKYLFQEFSYDEHIWKRFCLLKFCKPAELSTKETHREYYRRKMNFRNRVSHLSDFSLSEL